MTEKTRTEPDGASAQTGRSNRRNLLGLENSPYLLQHKDNPVHWMPWGEAARSRAKQEKKPILISIGYAACHWCHVMAHECFENDAIARQMNDLFVNVKVDREERPDVDSIYQQALALLGEHGGWPLTMFLTPDGDPFWGGTYFPPEDRYGRPGFPKVLQRIAEIYHHEFDKVRSNADALKTALDTLSANKSGTGISMAMTDQVAEQLLRMVDTVNGGFGSAPKFPQCAVFELLWRAWKRTGTPQFRDAVLLTLDRMCQGGIYDHLGGGFARYSVDPYWLVPHFEKMLYDNAQLIYLLTLAWQETRSPLYAARVRETVEWLMREMVVEVDGRRGGFAGTLDADSDGQEGKFYVWTESEIDALLGDEAGAFKLAYDVTPGGNWEGKTILNRSKRPNLGDVSAEAKLSACRKKLLAARAKRVRPGLDDKVLADWNGLAITALAHAGHAFGELGWIEAGQAAYDFVRTHMTEDGRLRHSWRRGRLGHPAPLDDYANMARAAVALFEVTADRDYLADAECWLGTVEAHYKDGRRGGYYLSADDVSDVILRPKTVFDNATPSGNGVLVEVFARLYHLTGDETFRNRADAQISAFSGELERSAAAMPALLNGNDILQNAVQVVVCGAADEAGTTVLVEAALGVSQPNRVLQVVAPGNGLPNGHPAYGKGPVDGKATAYVCRGTSCTLPITDATELTEEIRKS